MIEASRLTRRFGPLTAVDHLSLHIAAGEIYGLVGPDGAGKTTTLRILCGLMHATAGTARVAGFDVFTQTAQVKDRIGYMAQKFGLYGDLTVDENMRFYADLFGIPGPERERMTPELLRTTRMEPFRTRPAAQLSGGMKQKLALMCTLLHKPQVLILDEPTNGVDPVSRRDFWLILKGLVADGLTVLVATTYLDEAERCHRVGILHQGRLLLEDTPAALRASLDAECLEVRGADLRDLRRRLTAAPGITEVELAGSALHVFVPRGTGVEAVTRVAPEAHVRPILPSLEDVVIATVRRKERDAA